MSRTPRSFAVEMPPGLSPERHGKRVDIQIYKMREVSYMCTWDNSGATRVWEQCSATNDYEDVLQPCSEQCLARDLVASARVLRCSYELARCSQLNAINIEEEENDHVFAKFRKVATTKLPSLSSSSCVCCGRHIDRKILTRPRSQSVCCSRAPAYPVKGTRLTCFVSRRKMISCLRDEA